MSRSAKVHIFFGDAKYHFALRVGECEELQDLTDCGLMTTLQRLADVRVKDIKAVIRLGLIGEGMAKEAAFILTERHVAPGYLAEAALVASAIVNAVIAGVPDEPLGEEPGSATGDRRSPETSSDTPISTARAAPSAGPRKRSRKAASGA